MPDTFAQRWRSGWPAMQPCHIEFPNNNTPVCLGVLSHSHICFLFDLFIYILEGSGGGWKCHGNSKVLCQTRPNPPQALPISIRLSVPHHHPQRGLESLPASIAKHNKMDVAQTKMVEHLKPLMSHQSWMWVAFFGSFFSSPFFFSLCTLRRSHLSVNPDICNTHN